MSTVKTALVIGAGPAGMEAAVKIGGAGYRVILADRADSLGGTLRQLCSSFPRWEDPADLIAYKTEQINKCPLITIKTKTTVVAAEKNGNGYLVTLGSDGLTSEIQADAVIIATGFELFDASVYGEYGYGSFDNVVNSLEFEALLKEWQENQGKTASPGTVAFFKCVGSRDRAKGLPYCSRICCMYTAKQAGLVKELFPDSKCYVFYMDYRAAGREYEEFVRSVIEQRHVRYVRGRPAKVLPEDGRLLIRAEDTLMGMPVEIAADMVVLAAAIVPGPGTRQIARLFRIKSDEYGFIDYNRNEPAKAGDRVFFAGACGFAVETLGAIQQGAAAAAEVIALFNQPNGEEKNA
jgi:heterodisulfide reductase subunit A